MAVPRKMRTLKKKKKRVLLKFALGLFALLIAFIILVFSVDLNAFREPVKAGLSKATGMEINFDLIGWSFSKGLKLKCAGLQILSPETGKELLATNELLLKIKWLRTL